MMQRSVDTRLREGVVRDLIASVELTAAGYKVRNGPHVDRDSLKQAKQINVANMPGTLYGPGVGDSAPNERSLLVATYELYQATPSPLGGLDPFSTLDEIARTIIRGGADDNGLGRIVDPDAPANPTSREKYVNVSLVSIERLGEAIVVPSAIVAYPLRVVFRVDLTKTLEKVT